MHRRYGAEQKSIPQGTVLPLLVSVRQTPLTNPPPYPTIQLPRASQAHLWAISPNEVQRAQMSLRLQKSARRGQNNHILKGCGSFIDPQSSKIPLRPSVDNGLETSISESDRWHGVTVFINYGLRRKSSICAKRRLAWQCLSERSQRSISFRPRGQQCKVGRG